VRPDDPELRQLLHQFVPVRIVNFKGVDMNRFRFDYDLTFAVLMMDADGHVYARYGSQDWRSSAARMSIPGLKAAMREVLAMHRGRKPAADRQPNDGTQLVPEKRLTVADFPAFARSGGARGECYHCHFANNARFAQLRADGKFKKEMLFQYPLPENLGITLDVDANTLVASVRPDSPAARAGIRAGDRVVQANTTPVVTPADLQFVLNDVPDPGSVTLHLKRSGERPPPAVLQLPRGWRRTDISWRPSQDAIPPTVGIWAVDLTDEQRKQRGLAADRMALRVSFFFPGPQWSKTRGDLQMNDVIVGIDGEQLPRMSTRQFHSRFRLAFNVGDTATLNVLRGSERREIPVPCMEVREE
jgi:serine protease Do